MTGDEWKVICEMNRTVGEIHGAVQHIEANCARRCEQVSGLDKRVRVLESEREKRQWLKGILRSAAGIIGIKL